MTGADFAPAGWAFCDGQILPVDQNPRLFTVLKSTYGGDGRTTFALPDLRGRTPVHVNQTSQGAIWAPAGVKGGYEKVPIHPDEMPMHNHTVVATDSASTSADGTGNIFSQASAAIGGSNPIPLYGYPGAPVVMNPQVMGNAGSGVAHENMQPFLVVNFIISLQGPIPFPPS